MTTPTQQVIDTATDAVAAYKEIVSLKSQLITNPTTESDQTFNAGINSSLRTQQKRLKDDNVILRFNRVQALLLGETKTDEDGNVIAPWEFSRSIPGTKQNAMVGDGGDDTIQDTATEAENTYKSANDTLISSKDGLTETAINSISNNSKRARAMDGVLNDTIVTATNAQFLRQNFEDEIRRLNKIISENLRAINSISRELKKTTDPVEIENLMNQLADAQDTYQQAKIDKAQTQKALDKFLDTPEGRTTQVSNEAPEPLEGYTDAEKQAIDTLRIQYVDDLNEAETDNDRTIATTNIAQLDAAIKTGNVDRRVLDSPDYTKIEDYNVQLNTLINERNELQRELAATDPSDTVKIAQLTLELEDNAKARYELSVKIIGLQDNLGFGIKVTVERDVNNNPKLVIVDTTKGEYITDDVYLSDLSGPGSVINETIGFLNDQDFKNLLFATSTEVFDGRKSKIIPRNKAEAGQESRYTNVRPNLPDGEQFVQENGLTPLEEYEQKIQAELLKLEEDLDNNNDVVLYNNLIVAINEDIYNTFVKPLDDKIASLLEEIKSRLIEYGVAEEDINKFINDNSELPFDEFYQALYNAVFANLDVEQGE